MTDTNMPATAEAKQKAQEVGSNAAGRASEVMSDAQEQARAVTLQAKDELQKVWEQSRDEVAQQAQQRSQHAAGSLRTLGDRLGSLADGDTESAGPLLDYVRDGRDRVTSFADRLEQGPDVVLEDIRRFARNRPMVFLACAGGLGFLAGRLVRAGSSENGGSADAQGATADATPAAGFAAVDGGPGDIAMPPPDVDLVAGDPTMGDVRTGSVLDTEVDGLGSTDPDRPLRERP